MAANTLASIAAATTAGYKETVLDRGASFAPSSARFEVTLEKQLVGEPGKAGAPARAYGQGSSQANAEAQALAALNGFRDHRYGKDSAATSKGSTGSSLSLDVN